MMQQFEPPYIRQQEHMHSMLACKMAGRMLISMDQKLPKSLISLEYMEVAQLSGGEGSTWFLADGNCCCQRGHITFPRSIKPCAIYAQSFHISSSKRLYDNRQSRPEQGDDLLSCLWTMSMLKEKLYKDSRLAPDLSGPLKPII